MLKTKEEFLRLTTIVLNAGVILWILKIVTFDKLWGGVEEYIIYSFLALVALVNIVFAYRAKSLFPVIANSTPSILRYILFLCYVVLNVGISMFMLFQAAVESLKIDTLFETLIGSAFLLWSYLYLRNQKYVMRAFYLVLLLIILFATWVPIYGKYFISCPYTGGDVVICRSKTFAEAYWDFFGRFVEQN